MIFHAKPIRSYSEKIDETSVDDIVGNDLSEFREVPAIPFLNTHAQRIHILVEVLQHGNTVNNWLILSLDIELNTISTPAVS